MTRLFPRGRNRSTVQPAALFLGTSLLILILASWRGIVLEPPPSDAPIKPLQGVRAIERRVEPSGEVLINAVLNDPFRPDRKAPAERFLLPENRPPQDDDKTLAAGVAGGLKLLGTVVLQGGGAAMVEGQGESRVVRVGEEFEGYRLRNVERGRAVFVTPAGSPELLEVDKREG